MRLQQISEIIHQLCFGQIMDLLIEILADAPNGTRIGIYRLGLESFEFKVFEVGLVVFLENRFG